MNFLFLKLIGEFLKDTVQEKSLAYKPRNTAGTHTIVAQFFDYKQ